MTTLCGVVNYSPSQNIQVYKKKHTTFLKYSSAIAFSWKYMDTIYKCKDLMTA